MAYPERHITIGEAYLVTDVPPTADIFSDHPLQTVRGDRLGYAFNPLALETIEPGEYRVRMTPGDTPGVQWLFTHAQMQNIAVREGAFGAVVDVDSFGMDPLEYSRPTLQQAAAVPMMARLGYEVRDNQVTGIPVPSAFRHAAAEQGIDVRFYPNDTEIPPYDYLEAFAQGRYPVALGDEAYYLHDIADAHATGMLLGGALLRGLLREVAQTAIERGEAYKAHRIDQFAGLLRRTVVADGETFTTHDQRHFDSSSALSGMYGIGRELTLSPDETNVLIRAAISNAQHMGVPTQELHLIDPRPEPISERRQRLRWLLLGEPPEIRL